MASKDYIHGSLEDQLSPDIKKSINNIFKKVSVEHEFELMFFNYKRNENLMGFEKFLKILEYMNYRSKIKKMKLEKTISLDISYQPENKNSTSREVFRISVTGPENINKYLKMLHMRNNHVIFATLAKLLKDDKNITIIKKVKSKEDIIDIDDYDIRVRMSQELDVSSADLKMLQNLDNTARNNISFRYKQRMSLHVLDEKDGTIKIDLTNTKSDNYINAVQHAVPNYELEIDYMSNKSTPAHLTKIYSEATVLLKILQQSNYIIGATYGKEVLNRYADLISINKTTMTSLSGRQAHSLEIQHVVDKLPNKYAVTDKADGDRCYLIIYQNVVFFLTSNLHVINTGIILPDNKFNDTILDGELIFLAKKNRYIFMTFDCVYSQGKDIREDISFLDRLKEADNVIKMCFVTKEQKGYVFTDYKGDFNVDKIEEFHKKEIDTCMQSLNHDIEINKGQPLIRRKYFISVMGGQNNEIFKYSKIMWDKYVFDKKTACPYILDGLVFHPLEQKYVTSVKDSKFFEYKWKPPTKNSIDFYMQFEKNRDTGKQILSFDNSEENTVENKPYKIANLYVGSKGRVGGEVPVKFNPQDNKHLAYLFLENGDVRDAEGHILQDNTVVEFYYNNDPNIPDKHRWVPLRTRYDKTETVQRYKKKYGNYIEIAQKVWRSIKNPFTMADITILANNKTFDRHIDVLRGKIDHSVILSEAKEDAYYQIRTNLGKPMRNFHNWIKSVVIYTHCNPIYENNKSQTVLDIGVGRGGDIMKYYYAKADKYVGIDIDNNGIISPVDGTLSRYDQLKKTHPNFPRMYFINADGGVLLDFDEQIKILGSTSSANEKLMKQFFSLDVKKRTMFDRLSCQFAIHYFLASDATWNNFVQNVDMYLKPGGYMMIATFDGEAVTKLLADKEQHTSYYTNDKGEKKVLFEFVKKYDIKDINKPFGVGQAIDVFNGLISNDGVYNTEYLVDRRFLEQEFLDKCNMELVETDLFENQFNIHKEYFANAVRYEENVKTKAFFEKVAEYYDQTNEVNKACFNMTKLNRFYVFRKKDNASVKQIGSANKGSANKGSADSWTDYAMFDAPNYINPEHFIKRELTDNDQYSFAKSIHNICVNEGIVPESIDYQSFYKDIKVDLVKDGDLTKKHMINLSKNLKVDHEIEQSENIVNKNAINGLNIIVLDKDCNGIDVSAIGKKNSRDPYAIIYNDGSQYNPIYKVENGQNKGLHESKLKFIKKMINETD
jgi:SAM-dependent methyltransferase